MKRNYFQYTVDSVISVTKQELDQIAEVARSHYDFVCKEFQSQIGNWLYRAPEDGTEFEIHVDAEKFGIIQKILEQEGRVKGVQLYQRWAELSFAAQKEFERVNAHWMMNKSETFTERYRQQLKAKHGDGIVQLPADNSRSE